MHALIHTDTSNKEWNTNVFKYYILIIVWKYIFKLKPIISKIYLNFHLPDVMGVLFSPQTRKFYVSSCVCNSLPPNSLHSLVWCLNVGFLTCTCVNTFMTTVNIHTGLSIHALVCPCFTLVYIYISRIKQK